MRILNDEDLSKYTTLRIGGIAKRMYIPETINELCEVLCENKQEKYLLGGGSNLLINQREFEEVINLREFNRKIENLGEGVYCIGASVRLQELIREINSQGYGGIEYLYSVPGLVGGAIVMNAGGGKEQGWYISDYVISVKVYNRGKIITMSKEDCEFGYRDSLFKKSMDYIVLEVLCKFNKGNSSYFENARKQRMLYCKKYQDNSKGNCGSVFKECSSKLMRILKKIRFGNRRIHFSEKTSNWIINEGGASFKDINRILNCVKYMHKIIKKKCELEIVIWR